MAGERDPGEGRITTDRDTIETWLTDTEHVPVRREGRVRLTREAEVTDEHERLDFDAFHDYVDREEMAVIGIGEGDERRYEIVDYDEAIERATLADEDVEEALLAGETVRSQITETRVIEREIVETETIESEIVDTQVVDDEVVATQVLTQDLTNCTLVDDDTIEADLEVTETVTREVLEELTVESEVVDTDITERDTVEADDVEATVDIEGVQRTILQSDLLGSRRDRSVEREIIDSGAMESELRDEGVIHTTLYRRSVVDDEMAETRRVRANIVEEDVLESETISSEIIDADVVEGESLEELQVVGVPEEEVVDRESIVAEAEERHAATIEGTTTGAEMETTDAAAEESDTMTDTETEVRQTDTTEIVGAEGAGTTMDGVDTDEDEELRRMPTEDDRGKPVVDAEGERVGMVAKVEGNTMYVDPHPSLTDRLKARLDWGDIDDDAYPLTDESIDAITDDEVRLRIDRAGEDVPENDYETGDEDEY
jgi:hypothetical protein